MPTFKGKDLSTPIPPLALTFDYRIKKNVATGIYLGYSLTEATLKKEDNGKAPAEDKYVNNNFFLLGLRLEGHYIRGRTEFYGGAMLAYNFSDIKSNLEHYPEYTNIRVENYSDVFTWTGHIGVRHLISNQLGLFAEIGYGVSLFVIGTSLKI